MVAMMALKGEQRHAVGTSDCLQTQHGLLSVCEMFTVHPATGMFRHLQLRPTLLLKLIRTSLLHSSREISPLPVCDRK